MEAYPGIALRIALAIGRERDDGWACGVAQRVGEGWLVARNVAVVEHYRRIVFADDVKTTARHAKLGQVSTMQRHNSTACVAAARR